jgi:hypothetical protein
MNVDKLQKLQSQVRIGGKGTPRRKVKKHVKASGDDKKVDGALKKLHCQQIPAIEEVNMFKADGRVLHFNNPKGISYLSLSTTHLYNWVYVGCDLMYVLIVVEASIGSNLFVIRGHVQDKGTYLLIIIYEYIIMIIDVME